VIIQADQFDSDADVDVLSLHQRSADAPLFRVEIAPTTENGLVATSWLMTDKIIAVRRTQIDDWSSGWRQTTLLRLNRALSVFLGLGA